MNFDGIKIGKEPKANLSGGLIAEIGRKLVDLTKMNERTRRVSTRSIRE